jgi:hypothetical protein
MRTYARRGLLLAALACAGGTATPTLAATHECAAIDDSLQRLMCYDRAFPRDQARPAAATAPDALPSTSEAPAVPSIPGAAVGASATATTAASQTPGTSQFGFTDAEVKRAAKKKEDPSSKGSERDAIQATVKEVKRRKTGEFIATFEDGQVWAQAEVESKARIRPGDTVTIRRASLGSYMLITTAGVGTRVRRVQ